MKWIAPHGAVTADERYRNAEPNIPGSNPDAAFFNNVLDELLAVITTAHLTPTDQNLHQISDAIVYLTERAATSGVTKGAFWFGKTTASFTVPAPTIIGQNYIDFTTLKTYESLDGSTWTETGTFVKPDGIDFTILITSKFWDIPEQNNQQGGDAKYNHTDDIWAYWPKIVEMPAGKNIGDMFWTFRTDTELNGSVECNGSTYNTTDFTGSQNIGSLLAAGKIPYVSLATYATMLSTNGAVGVFGWDGAGTTAFRVPTKRGRFLVRSKKKTSDADRWYNVYSDGWVEQGGDTRNGSFLIKMANSNYSARVSPMVMYAGERSVGNGISSKSTTGVGFNFGTLASTVVDWVVEGYADPTEYAESAWDYQEIQYQRPMVQLATSASDEAVMICTGVTADVADLKANAYTRSFTALNTTVASSAGSGIAGTYQLGFTDNKVKLGLFFVESNCTQAGGTSVALATDVATYPCQVCGTNNSFTMRGCVMLPFINEITISFPETGGGVGHTALYFRGWM